MRAGKVNQEEDEYEEDEFGCSKKHGPSSAPNTNNNNKDSKAIDKASAIRSKHSVTEQRRRSKINERFQMLRDLIPHSDQKRDTASFLLEVIEYVQYLQEKLQKYEGSYQGWSHEPSKLMPWRNSHWRLQSFVGQPQAVKNGSGPVSPFPGKFDESNTSISPTMRCGSQSMLDPDQNRDIASKTAERQPDLASKGIPLPLAMHSNMSVPVRSDGVLAHPLQGTVSDAQSTEYPVTSEPQNQQDELTIEGGTISISSAYSQGLLNNLTQALQSAGIDLSQASISVQINLGKRANEGPSCGTSSPKGRSSPPVTIHTNGKGMIVGILDAGINPLHPSFSDEGMPPPPAKWNGHCEFTEKRTCNNKLMGSRNFSENSTSALPPFGYFGHGTHTACTASGRLVKGASILGHAMGTTVGSLPDAHLAI